MAENNQQPSRPNIFSEEFIEQIGEDLANQIVDQICQGLTQMPPRQQPTSLCLEIVVFDIDKDVLKTLVKCVFEQMNPVLIAQDILNLIGQVNGTEQVAQEDDSPSTIRINKFKLVRKVMQRMDKLKKSLYAGCDLRENIYEQILLQPTQLPTGDLKNISNVIEHVITQQFRQLLKDQYDNFALKLCNKVSCIFSDLEFLAEQIKRVTVNLPASEEGIIEVADAAADVAESFFSEEDDFSEIFDAVDEIADLLESLAEFYQYKLKQLEELLSLSTAGCPVPIEARATLPSIPQAPPPSPVFTVVTQDLSSIIPTGLGGQ